MKKVVVILSIVTVLALALPALALPSVGGILELEGTWQQDADVIVENQAKFALGFDARTRAGIEMELGNGYRFFDGFNPTHFQRGYLQRLGSLWNGGPQMVTTIGGLRFKHSPYVAWVGNKMSEEGISFDGYRRGPVTAGVFYTVDQAMGGKIEADLEQLKVAGTVVHDQDQTALDITGQIEPLEGAIIAGTYATANDAEIIKLDGGYSITPQLSVVAGYRSFDPLYNAKMSNPDLDPFNPESNPVEKYRGLRGYTVGLRTGAYGLVFSADADQYERIATGAREDALRFGAAKEFDLAGNRISTSYQLRVPSEADVEHQLQAAYRAPNGLGVEALYNNVTGGLARVGMNVAF